MFKEYAADLFREVFKSVTNNLKKYNFATLNYRLIVFVIALTTIGINVIGSATDRGYEKSQLQGLCLGLILMAIIMLINYNFILRFYWLFYIINLLCLAAVKFTSLGTVHGGAKRWILIGSFQFQPSELTKLLLLLFFAMFFSKYKEKLSSFKFFFISVALFAVPAALIESQPDLSTTIVLFLVFCAIIFVAGLSYKIIGICLAVIIPLAAILIGVILYLPPDNNIIEKYQYERIIGFYSGDEDISADILYQQENSVMAIGSGGLSGKGLNNNTVTSVKNGNYISEPQTDFIFTIVGEELGFIGATAVIVLLFLIMLESFRSGMKSDTLAGRIICIGFGSWIAFQSFINICVVTMLVPNTGLPLPFVSYGQTSLICLYMGVGLVLNVSIQTEKKKRFKTAFR